MAPSVPRTASKTPFEIRLDLLILAKEILMARHLADAVAKANSGTWTPGEAILASTSPTAEDVIAEATKLNGFVSQTQQNPQH